MNGEDLTAIDDIFRWGALGKTCKRVWFGLDPETDITTQALASKLRKPVRTVRRGLARLAAVGLAREAPGSHWRRLEPDLKALAAELGCAGKSARQHEEHRRERAAYRSWQDARGGRGRDRGLY